VERLHIVGGGSKNVLLNQLTADAANIDVIAGPTEATASGNVLVQAIAEGVVSDLNEARQIINRSFDTETFNPKVSLQLDTMITRFDQLCGNSQL
jgi:rhamnulokinase